MWRAAASFTSCCSDYSELRVSHVPNRGAHSSSSEARRSWTQRRFSLRSFGWFTRSIAQQSITFRDARTAWLVFSGAVAGCFTCADGRSRARSSVAPAYGLAALSALLAVCSRESGFLWLFLFLFHLFVFDKKGNTQDEATRPGVLHCLDWCLCRLATIASKKLGPATWPQARPIRNARF